MLHTLRYFKQNDKFLFDYDDLNNLVTKLQQSPSDNLDLVITQTHETWVPPCINTKINFYTASQQKINETYFNVIGEKRTATFKKNLSKLMLTGDETLVTLFKTVVPCDCQELSDKKLTISSCPNAHDKATQKSNNDAFSNSINQTINNYPAKTTDILTKEQRDKIKQIINQYQSRSWQALLWNTIFFGVFGKHYSQTLKALDDLVGNNTNATQVNKTQILDAIQVESKYAAHRMSLFNKPDKNNILSGTDKVIYELSSILRVN